MRATIAPALLGLLLAAVNSAAPASGEQVTPQEASVLLQWEPSCRELTPKGGCEEDGDCRRGEKAVMMRREGGKWVEGGKYTCARCVEDQQDERLLHIMEKKKAKVCALALDEEV